MKNIEQGANAIGSPQETGTVDDTLLLQDLLYQQILTSREEIPHYDQPAGEILLPRWTEEDMN